MTQTLERPPYPPHLLSAIAQTLVQASIFYQTCPIATKETEPLSRHSHLRDRLNIGSRVLKFGE